MSAFSSTTKPGRVLVLPRSLHAFGTSILLIPLGIASSILIARTIGPAGKGNFDLIVATATLLGMALGLSLPSGVTYVVARGKANLNVLAGQLLGIALLQGLLVAALLATLRYTGYATALLPQQMGGWLILGIAVFVVGEMLANHARAMLTGRQEIAAVNNCELLGRLVQFLLLFILAGTLYALGGRISVAVLFALTLAVTAFINFLLLKALSLTPRLSSDTGTLREVTAFAWPCYLGNLTQFLNYRLDVFIVSYFAGYAAVGRYTLAVSLAQMIWLMSNAAATVLLPKIAAADSAVDNVAHTARVTRLAFCASLLAALALALFASQTLTLFYGEAFRQSVAALLWILPGIVAFSTVNVLAAYLAGCGRPQLNLFVSLAALSVTLVLDVTLIPRLNIVGAALASTASYSLSAVLTIWFFVRVTGVGVRQVLLPTVDDVRFIVALARPVLKRMRLQQAGSG